MTHIYSRSADGRTAAAIPGRPGRLIGHCSFLILVLFAACPANAQQQISPSDMPRPGMTQDRLYDLIVDIGTDVVISGNIVQFSYDDVRLICISDSAADRMRIISPIVDLVEIGSDQMLLAFAANFHTVLDVRYALSDGVIYAAYIHPLSPLTNAEVLSAIRQVATARNTFGNEYTSGALVFPGATAQ